jgi:hypothetical protein
VIAVIAVIARDRKSESVPRMGADKRGFNQFKKLGIFGETKGPSGLLARL